VVCIDVSVFRSIEFALSFRVVFMLVWWVFRCSSFSSSSPPISGRPLLSELVIMGLFVSFPRWVVIVSWTGRKLYGGGLSRGNVGIVGLY
jgi:hypothetical protein